MASEARPSISEVRSNGLPRCARSDGILTRRDEIFLVSKSLRKHFHSLR